MKPFGLRSLSVAALFTALARPVHATPVSLTATTLYTAASQCGANPSSSGVPVQVNAVPVAGSGSCSPDHACGQQGGSVGGYLYPDVNCFTSDGTAAGAFEVAVKNLFGSNPYLIVETFSSASCAAPADITGITAYWADGRCHKTDTSASYKATRSPDGSASVLTYSTADCTGSAVSTFMWTAAMADPSTGNACDGSPNGPASKKVYGGGATFYLTSTVNFHTNVGGCHLPVVPTQLITTVGLTDTCAATSTCAAGSAVPYTKTACDTVATYKTNVAGMYGFSPYVIVESYTAAKSCDPAFLTGVVTYLAEGKCHKTDTSASYRATRAADGSASVITYSTADCSGTAASTLTWTTVMADPSTGNTCDGTANGILDTKVSGSGITAYLTSVANFDTNVGGCRSPAVPTQLVTTVGATDTCAATSTCAGSAVPYTTTTCNSMANYKTSVATMYGASPYVIVESYASTKSCDPTYLTGVVTYLADNVCHVTGSASYKATRQSSGAAVVITYSTADCSGTAASTLTWTAAMAIAASGNTCDSTANGLLDTKVYGSGVTSYLTSVVNYDTSDGCNSPAVPTQITTTVSSSSSCTATSVCAGSAVPYTRTACNSVANYRTDVLTMYGSSPYVTVESYQGSQNCDPTFLAGIVTYLADGVCHKTSASTSYVATRAADGSAIVKTSTGSDVCAGNVATLDVSSVQAKIQSCAADANGIADTKIYGAGTTTLYLTSALGFDDNSGSCVSPSVPTSVTTTVAASSTACTATAVCGGTADPWTGTACSTSLTYSNDLLALVSTKPYVMVESYTAGKQCDGTKLLSKTTYLADGVCHKTGATTSYVATRAADGSAIVKTSTGSNACAGNVATLDVSSVQAKGQSCAADANGIADTKIYGAGTTTLYLTSALGFDDNSGSCVSPSVPTSVTTTVAASSTACTATAVCGGTADPWTGTACSTSLTYSNDLLALVNTKPYVMVESYTAGKQCDGTKLLSKTTYLADGVCHKTGATTSYVATRAADGSAIVKTSTGSNACAGNVATLDVSSVQAKGQSCAADANGIADKKIYGAGTTTLYLTSALGFDDNSGSCVSPSVPTSVTTTVAASSTACTATAICGGTADPWTGTACSTSLTYSNDLLALVSTKPYVMVESYTAGKQCDGTKLLSKTTYLADGVCHKTGATTSYVATRAADGSAIVKTSTGSNACAGSVATLDVSSVQAKGQSCAADANGIADKKIYGAGTTTLYLTSALGFDDNSGSCVSPSVPTSVTTTVAASSTACTATAICGGTADPWTGTACSTSLTYSNDLLALVSTKPYVMVESYTAGKQCDGTKLLSKTTYLADGVCHKTGATTSYVATRAADGSAIVKTSTGSNACAGSVATLDVSSVQAKGQSCAADANGIADKKIYGAGTTTLYLTSALGFDTNTGSCVSPVVPTSVTTTVAASSTACTATAVCGGTADPWTGTACSTSLTYSNDLLALVSTKPYVMVESYTAGKQCDGTKLLSKTTYLADGVCHKTGATTSYVATRAADGSAIVKTSTGSNACAGSVATLDVSSVQAKGQSCAADANGIADKKIYGAGTTTLYLTSALGFDTNTGSCVSPVVPTSVTTTVAASSTACTATAVCGGTADPWTGTACSTSLTYSNDLLKLFGTKPYVMVESYTAGKKCDGTKLLSKTTYLADGVCHKTGATTSYVATRAADGSVVVKTSTGSNACAGTVTTLNVSSTQAKGQSCAADANGVLDKKIYGVGQTATVFSAVVFYDDKTCGTPSQLTVSDEFSCATAECSVSGDRSLSHACPDDYFVLAKSVFGSTPFVVVEMYAENTCDTKQGVMALLADSACHSTLDGASSFKVSVDATGAMTELLYPDKTCSSSTPVTISLTSDQLSSQACTEGKKYYGINTPTTTTAPPTTDAPSPTPTPTTAANTGTEKSAAALVPVFSLLAMVVAVFGGAAALLL